jgi:leucyl aminopeptidase
MTAGNHTKRRVPSTANHARDRERQNMQIDLATGAPQTIETPCLVLGAFADGALTPAAAAVDTASGGRLGALVRQGDLATAAGATLTLFGVNGVAATRVMLVSLGKQAEFGDRAWRQALAGAGRALAAGPATEAVVTLADIAVPSRSSAWTVREATRVLADSAYRFALPAPTGSGKPASPAVCSACKLLVSAATPELAEAVRHGAAMAEGQALAKDLGNMPGNICNPAYFAVRAQEMAQAFPLKVEVLERADMEKLGMGSFLSVGRASANPCKLIVIRHDGGKPGDKPVVLVGKGITFDTGGVSLKPGANLDEMKFDMGGAGSVFGAMQTVARLNLPLNVIGIIAAAENMPGGDASRPGDVVRSMSGMTIEILNTDAEGRLLLCDALTYAERFDPACVVDIATLTGACVIALGAHASGLFANEQSLADALLASGQTTGDRAWQMPLWDDYMSQLRTNFADISNLGGPAAGAVTAALFLSRFAGAYPWAHIDIAGTGSVSGEAKGSTGRPVPLLTDFLLARAYPAA